jgi:hypothetical protein
MVVTRIACALNNKHVSAPNVVAYLNRELAIAKANHLNSSQLNSECLARRLRKALV